MTTSDTNILSDNDVLHQRIAQLERENARLRQRITLLESNEQRFVSFMDNLPGAAFINSSANCVTYANDWYFRQFGWNPDEVLNRPYHELLPQEAADSFVQQDREVLVSNTVQTYEDVVETPSGLRYYLTTKFPIPRPDKLVDIGGFTLEITERKRAEWELQRIEQERQQWQQEIIDAQRNALRELSTPLIPLTDSVVLMPLIGTVDSQRTQQVMETLLEGVGVQQANIAILDITGVRVIDSQVADALIRTAQAVRLLGAQIILTGIGPTVAQTMVHLGIDLSGIRTESNLQQAIRATLLSEAQYEFNHVKPG